MPELPEVEGVVRSLQPVVAGKTIRHVEVSNTICTSINKGKACIIKGMDPETFSNRLKGTKIMDVERRSKYIYFYLEDGADEAILVNHLGMTGAWFHVHSLNEIKEEKFRKHIHVILAFEEDEFLVYADIRRFGELRLLDSIADHPPLLEIAPEPFSPGALEYFLMKSALPKYANKPVKEVIMDSHVVAGCGNIYATEALFRMKIHPNRKMARISEKRKKDLFAHIVAILQESIEAGGSSISDYRNINGEAGSMQNRLQMYGRKACPICHTNTKQMVIAGRNSVYCPHCQH
ncbi:bifunctional DNA-formamidopyrimidine glycosylase/DNA-(apurinic or apyrimidinic site) lyase [Rummeliibacillus stabekisii]|uniref:Formamidopyrimidine-DNA glycosylase n=1 Tax=Rummeliibacillus stabekisii TaxID=241244 RepID=A0A143HCU9_9BACL|nr:bifunctional DNA-formamidopyrimidine glycosylase/DNA-(apurinic or apyrimidinic site) lyase [Rummeliibacillus stabekisii]AMW99587.1 DNA-formamidopyrimidine glycosylase [Rummeliibacillus stabekisii]MCM3316974.1 bifunctional DNA-formamidopyrimidine glycosylase/DNA-(apurinic or apyrimidinic site) lyase [Rummeliibacillus stabekisii]